MLRTLFGEPPREWAGKDLETVQSIQSFIRSATELARKGSDRQAQYRTFAIWAEGLLRALDELEQSRYAAKRFAGGIRNARMDELSEEERLDYNRHVYFDKNAYTRIFSLLDKLGTLLNGVLELRTEKIKSQFSYFTVLRNMRLNGLHGELMLPLNALKERHQETLSRLRGRRNIEIHQMNAELQDDLRRVLDHREQRRTMEDIASNMHDLDRGWEMAGESLGQALRYACERLRHTSK